MKGLSMDPSVLGLKVKGFLIKDMRNSYTNIYGHIYHKLKYFISHGES